jgi:predicted acylesterase/phospholipase RssA
MAASKPKFDDEILLLQGGGALGAYRTEIDAGLAEAGRKSWVVCVPVPGLQVHELTD